MELVQLICSVLFEWFAQLVGASNSEEIGQNDQESLSDNAVAHIIVRILTIVKTAMHWDVWKARRKASGLSKSFWAICWNWGSSDFQGLIQSRFRMHQLRILSKNLQLQRL